MLLRGQYCYWGVAICHFFLDEAFDRPHNGMLSRPGYRDLPSFWDSHWPPPKFLRHQSLFHGWVVVGLDWPQHSNPGKYVRVHTCLHKLFLMFCIRENLWPTVICSLSFLISQFSCLLCFFSSIFSLLPCFFFLLHHPYGRISGQRTNKTCLRIRMPVWGGPERYHFLSCHPDSLSL